MEDRPFVVLKFPNPEAEDEVFYEVGLAKWLLNVDDEMRARTYWPPKESLVAAYVRKELSADKDAWPVHRAVVKRYYDTYLNARNAVKGFLAESSAYESERELGRGRRKKRTCPELESSDSDSPALKRKRSKVIRPPAIPLAAQFSPKPGPSRPIDESKRKVKVRVLEKSSLEARAALKAKGALKAIKETRKTSKEKLVDQLKGIRQKCVEKKAEDFQKPVASTSTACIEESYDDHSSPGRYVKSPKRPKEIGGASSLLSAKIAKLNSLKTKDTEEFHSESHSKEPAVGPTSCNSFEGLNQGDDATFASLGGSVNGTEDSGNVLGTIAKSLQRTEMEKTPSGKNSSGLRSPSSRDTIAVVPSPFASSPNWTASNLRRMSPIQSPLDQAPYKRALFSPEKRALTASESKIFKQLGLMTRKIDAVEKKVDSLCHLVNEVSSKIDITLMNQGKLNRLLLPQEKRIFRPPNLPSLPLKTLQEVDAFEKFLGKEINITGTCDHLGSCGLPNDEKEAAIAVMTKLLTNSVAKEFNLDGKGEKIGLKELKLWKVIQGTLAFKFSGTLEEGVKGIRRWLVNAPWRSGEGTKRRVKSNERKQDSSAAASDQDCCSD